jgi:hypothetical protein
VCSGGVPGYSVGNPGGLINSYSNRGRTLMDGVDIDARTRFALGEWGKLSTGIAATIRKRDTHDSEDGSDIKGNTVGYYDSPRYRATVNADWSYRNFVSSVFINYRARRAGRMVPGTRTTRLKTAPPPRFLPAGQCGRAVVHDRQPGLSAGSRSRTWMWA